MNDYRNRPPVASVAPLRDYLPDRGELYGLAGLAIGACASVYGLAVALGYAG